MFGMRCEECGEVRWSIRAVDEAEMPCPACGAEMLVERRYPGRDARRRFRDERRAVPAAEVAGGTPVRTA